MRNPAFTPDVSKGRFPRPLVINTGQYRVSTPSTGVFTPANDELAVSIQNDQPVLVLVLHYTRDGRSCIVKNVMEDAQGNIALGTPYNITTPFYEYIGPIRVAKHVSYQLIR